MMETFGAAAFWIKRTAELEDDGNVCLCEFQYVIDPLCVRACMCVCVCVCVCVRAR